MFVYLPKPDGCFPLSSLSLARVKTSPMTRRPLRMTPTLRYLKSPHALVCMLCKPSTQFDPLFHVPSLIFLCSGVHLHRTGSSFVLSGFRLPLFGFWDSVQASSETKPPHWLLSQLRPFPLCRCLQLWQIEFPVKENTGFGGTIPHLVMFLSSHTSVMWPNSMDKYSLFYHSFIV